MQQIKGINRRDEGYKIDQSLLFDGGTLQHTFASVPDNAATRTNTISLWFKMYSIPTGSSATRQYLVSLFQDSDNRQHFGLDNDGYLWAYCQKGGQVRLDVKTKKKLADAGAWYHLVQRVDTYDTEIERCQLYINGELQELQSGGVIADQGSPLMFFGSGWPEVGVTPHVVGSYHDGSYRVRGYMAEINATGGTNLDFPASRFAHEDSNGIYSPIPFDGDYGANGFYLNFSDPNNIGADSSGNGNDFSLSGVTSDNLSPDTPSNSYSNFMPYPTWYNASTGLPSWAISNGGKTVEQTNNSGRNASYMETISFKTGKFWRAWRIDAIGSSYDYVMLGFASLGMGNRFQDVGICVQSENGLVKFWDGGTTVPELEYGVGDIIGFAVDVEAKKVEIFKNGVLGYTTSEDQWHDPGGGIAFGFEAYNAGGSSKVTMLDEGAPHGFQTLCTNNILYDIQQPDTMYQGNGSADGPFLYTAGPIESFKLNGTTISAPEYNPLDSRWNWVSNGLKSVSPSANTNGVVYNITDVALKEPFKYSRGQ